MKKRAEVDRTGESDQVIYLFILTRSIMKFGI